MSESNSICPSCDRAPGKVHHAKCARGMKAVRSRQYRARRWPARLIWTKGVMIIKTRWGPTKKLWNPGIPHVMPPKPWYAGGIPGGGDPHKLGGDGPVQDFVRAMAKLVRDTKPR